MPSLHKRPESPYWVASYQDAKGRWLKKSTKTDKRSLALKIAMEWENAGKSGRAGRLVESQCRKVLSEILEQSTGSPIHFHTCRDWFTEWLAGKDGATAARTLLKYKQVAADFLEHLGDRAALPLNAISPADVRSYRDALTKGGRAVSTVNMTLRKVLSVPFQAALRLGYIPMNPCSGVEILKDTGGGEVDTFTPEQVAVLLSVAENDWRGVILAGYFTGLRLGDITGLQWQSIELGSGLLKVKTGKTGKTVVIPLAPELAEWLRAQPTGIGKAPVFPSLAGLSGPGRNGLSMQFKRLMERAKIKGKVLRERKKKSAGRTRSSLSFHSLRHSFNSALANAGVSQEVRQKLTGHASATMNARYTHHEVDTLRDAVGKLPTIMRRGKSATPEK